VKEILREKSCWLIVEDYAQDGQLSRSGFCGRLSNLGWFFRRAGAANQVRPVNREPGSLQEIRNRFFHRN
jgi:hypothetical protein